MTLAERAFLAFLGSWLSVLFLINYFFNYSPATLIFVATRYWTILRKLKYFYRIERFYRNWKQKILRKNLPIESVADRDCGGVRNKCSLSKLLLCFWKSSIWSEICKISWQVKKIDLIKHSKIEALKLRLKRCLKYRLCFV